MSQKSWYHSEKTHRLFIQNVSDVAKDGSIGYLCERKTGPKDRVLLLLFRHRLEDKKTRAWTRAWTRQTGEAWPATTAPPSLSQRLLPVCAGKRRVLLVVVVGGNVVIRLLWHDFV